MLPCNVAGMDPIVTLTVEGVDVSAGGIIGVIPAARCSHGTAFGGDDGFIGVFCMESVEVFNEIVGSHDVDDILNVFPCGGDICRGGGRTCRIKAVRQRDHGLHDASAVIVGKKRLLVAHAPQNDGRMISVAADQCFQLVKMLGRR